MKTNSFSWSTPLHISCNSDANEGMVAVSSYFSSIDSNVQAHHHEVVSGASPNLPVVPDDNFRPPWPVG